MRASPLLFEAAARARPDRFDLFQQAEADRQPPNSYLGDGGSRSRAAASYSSVARLRGAEFLALTGCTWPTQFPEQPPFLPFT